MAPKRKAPAAAKSSAKKAKAKDEAPAAPPPAAPPAAASSPGKSKPLGSKSASEVWSSAEYVQGGKMGHEGFAALLSGLGIEEMTFEAVYLGYKLAPSQQTVDDVMTVCASKQALQNAMDSLGCRSLAELPAKLNAKRMQMQSDFGPSFTPFFRWLFEMGKAIAAMNNEVDAGSVRIVPLAEGLALMEAVLEAWPLMGQLKTFCVDKYAQPFSKDLWTQIGRFAHMTRTGQIRDDLSNYDDESAGGSAWPCAIDDFVEFVQADAS